MTKIKSTTNPNSKQTTVDKRVAQNASSDKLAMTTKVCHLHFDNEALIYDERPEMKRDTTDYVGQVFGHLTVVSEAETINNKRYVNCNCDCGSSIKVRLSSLKDGHTKSCNCLSRDKASQRLKKVHATACQVPTKAYIYNIYAYLMALWTEGELQDRIETSISIQNDSENPQISLALIQVHALFDNTGNSDFSILIREDKTDDFYNPETSLFVQNGLHNDFNRLEQFEEYQDYADNPVYLRAILLVKNRVKSDSE